MLMSRDRVEERQKAGRSRQLALLEKPPERGRIEPTPSVTTTSPARGLSGACSEGGPGDFEGADGRLLPIQFGSGGLVPLGDGALTFRVPALAEAAQFPLGAVRGPEDYRR